MALETALSIQSTDRIRLITGLVASLNTKVHRQRNVLELEHVERMKQASDPTDTSVRAFYVPKGHVTRLDGCCLRSIRSSCTSHYTNSSPCVTSSISCILDRLRAMLFRLYKHFKFAKGMLEDLERAVPILPGQARLARQQQFLLTLCSVALCFWAPILAGIKIHELRLWYCHSKRDETRDPTALGRTEWMDEKSQV